MTKPTGNPRGRPPSHGYSRTPTYRSWQSMKTRCYNEASFKYPDYGGRGVTVCKRWLKSFEAFLADMGERPEGTTLDRRDGKKGYSKANCRWATREEQLANWYH